MIYIYTHLEQWHCSGERGGNDKSVRICGGERVATEVRWWEAGGWGRVQQARANRVSRRPAQRARARKRRLLVARQPARVVTKGHTHDKPHSHH